MLLPLTGRNPFALAMVLLATVAVREALPPDARSGWAWIVKLGVVFAALSVVFNVLTVRAGNRAFGQIPSWVPLIDGSLTLNSVVFGLLSGLAVLVLVLVGITLAAVLDWSAVLRLLPQSLTGAGVAGSVAFTFFPQMVASYREIADAQAMRGVELRGPRDYLNMAPLLLSGGIERAVTMSELLESRGFGGAPAPRRSLLMGLLPALGLGALCVGVYLFAVGEPEPAMAGALIGSACLAVSVRSGRQTGVKRTKYRPLIWRGSDWVVLAGALIAAGSILLAERPAVHYEPYPTLTPPVASLPLAVGLLGLLGPALVLLWNERGRA